MSQQQSREEMVLVAGHHAHSAQVYHTDPDCAHVKQTVSPPQEMPREVAERQYRECAVCKGTDNIGEADRVGIECPKCGQKQTNLPVHIRSCTGEPELEDVPNVGEVRIRMLAEVGIESVDDLANASPTQVSATIDLAREESATIIREAAALQHRRGDE